MKITNSNIILTNIIFVSYFMVKIQQSKLVFSRDNISLINNKRL